MSSIKTTTNLSNSSMNTEFMRYIKYADAFVNSKDIRRYSYNPYLIEKAVLRISSSQIFNLMVGKMEVNLGEHLCSRLIKQDINAG
jgi:hypothetical protein